VDGVDATRFGCSAWHVWFPTHYVDARVGHK
jgi:hypothetical protein